MALFRYPLPHLSSVFKVAAVALAVLVLPPTAGNRRGGARQAGWTADDPLREVRVDASRVVGAVRSFQGVNGGPAPLVPELSDVSAGYRDVGVDLVRTHDFFGPTDIDARWPNPDRIAVGARASGDKVLFPNPSADPDREESYNFGPTDRVIQAIVNSGAEVYFRIGRSWAADPAPPSDFETFAGVVKHVAMHYNQGWADGSDQAIRYWEFWNEPDLQANWFPGFARPFWSGTPDRFHLLYEKTARALKSVDPGLKVGTCGKAAPLLGGPYREGLMRYCAARSVPLDFFSWHHYADGSLDPYDLVRIGAEYRRLLDSSGLQGTEIHVTEWSASLAMFGAGVDGRTPLDDAVFTAAALIYLQDSVISRALHYRGDATKGGLFRNDGSYRKKAYAFKAMGAMLATPERLAATGGDTIGFALLAGRSKDGRVVQIVIANHEIPPDHRRPNTRPGSARLPPQTDIVYRSNRGYRLTVTGLPWGRGGFSVRRYRLNTTEDLAAIEEPDGRGASYALERPLPPPGLELIVLRAK